MPLLTTVLPKDQDQPELSLTMTVTMPQLMSQHHLNLTLHLKKNVQMIMYLWDK